MESRYTGLEMHEDEMLRRLELYKNLILNSMAVPKECMTYEKYDPYLEIRDAEKKMKLKISKSTAITWLEVNDAI